MTEMAKMDRKSGHRPKFASQIFFSTYQNVGLGFEIFKIGQEMANLGEIILTDSKALVLIRESSGNETLAVVVKSIYF